MTVYIGFLGDNNEKKIIYNNMDRNYMKLRIVKEEGSFTIQQYSSVHNCWVTADKTEISNGWFHPISIRYFETQKEAEDFIKNNYPVIVKEYEV